MYERIANPETVTRLPIIQGTFGCPCGRHVAVDPYWDAADWHEAARGDGGSYAGIVEWVQRMPGEAFDAFMARAEATARKLDTCWLSSD